MVFTRIIILITVIALSGCNNILNNKNGNTNKSNIKISDIALIDLGGKALSLDQYAGKTLFVNFWATWCKPCIHEMPSIQRVMEQLKNENIEFLFASDESVAVLERFSSNNNYPFQYVRGVNMEELMIQGLPTTFIFNPSGKLIFNEIGSRQWDTKNSIDLIKKIIHSQ